VREGESAACNALSVIGSAVYIKTRVAISDRHEKKGLDIR
jgi:hypothetical protein